MMKFFSLSSLLPLYLSLQAQRASAFAIDESHSNLRRASSIPSCLICNVAPADVQYGFNKTGPVNDFLACISESSQEPNGKANQVYLLDQLPRAFLRQYKRQIYSGNSRICIHQGRLNRTSSKVMIPNNTTIQLLPPITRRRLYPTIGQSKVLVVRVTSTAGEDPGLTADQLSGVVFGSGTFAQSVNPVSQIGNCSNGKWNLVPATGNNVVNGILEVQYNGSVAGGNIVGSLQTAINQLVLKGTGSKDLSSAADHILFCLPTGSFISGNNSNWIAFSYLNNVVSYFQKGWCQRITAVVHELGHQIGFRHSGLGTNEYGDQSCTMGSSYNSTGRPQECFNGHKNWLSGWFDDAKVAVNPLQNGPWVGNLVSFVDYSLRGQAPQSTNIINAGDLYIEYNRAKSYNYQVVTNADRITVVKNNATASYSTLLVGLVSGQTYTYANFSGSGIALVIQICSITTGTIDFAKISLYMKDGVQTSKCSTNLNPTAPPVPTPPPTRSPTRRPTPLPTPKPTPVPTNLPTPSPTLLPTSSPTSSPSIATSPPTASPTATPSPPPTSPPTDVPSVIGQTQGISPTTKAINVNVPAGVCFSLFNTVEVAHKGVISMKDLQIGDLVRTDGEAFDRVYSFGHYNQFKHAEYLRLHIFNHRQPLEISKDHLLFVEGTAIPASNVTVGDMIDLEAGVSGRVTKINAVVRSGAYAPFTMSGTIVVSGVKASSYVTLQEGSHVLVLGGYRTPITMHWLAHVFQSPHRLVCLTSPENCKSESYSSDGISKWVEGPLHVSQWLLQQNSFVMIAVLIPGLMLVLITYAIELCLFGSQALLLILLSLAAGSLYCCRQKNARKTSA